MEGDRLPSKERDKDTNQNHSGKNGTGTGMEKRSSEESTSKKVGGETGTTPEREKSAQEEVEEVPNYFLDPHLDLISEFGLSKLFRRYVSHTNSSTNPNNNPLEGSETIPENYLPMLKDFGDLDCVPEHYFEQLMYHSEPKDENLTLSPTLLNKTFVFKTTTGTSVDVSNLGKFTETEKESVLDDAKLPLPKVTIKLKPETQEEPVSPAHHQHLDINLPEETSHHNHHLLSEENDSSRSERKHKKKKKRRHETEEVEDQVDIENLDEEVNFNSERLEKKKKKKKKKKSKEDRHHRHHSSEEEDI